MIVPLFSIRGLSVAVPGRRLLQDLSLDLPGGAMTALIGHNGSGKSTLLKVLARQVAPAAGTVLFEGRALPSAPCAAPLGRALRRAAGAMHSLRACPASCLLRSEVGALCRAPGVKHPCPAPAVLRCGMASPPSCRAMPPTAGPLRLFAAARARRRPRRPLPVRRARAIAARYIPA